MHPVKTSANQRTDAYGGNIPNNVRFVLEVMQELTRRVGSEKVCIKRSPFHPYVDIVLDAPVSTYTYLTEKLNKMDFAYVELMRSCPNSLSTACHVAYHQIEFFGRKIRQTVIANAGYDRNSAETEPEKNVAKLISFGKIYIANPDLTERFEKNATLNEPNRATMYSGGKHGYVDYPLWNE